MGKVKELVIISGKGGTGKTSITAAFAALAENQVIADCDVDAADLHLILEPEVKYREDFRGGRTASIDKNLCTQCGKCIEVCRFDAISKDFVVDNISCEGCGVCVYFCPVKAIDFPERIVGEWFISETRFGPMVHAKLGIAQENSGKLVTTVRRNAGLIAEKENKDLIIIDGAPGVGCPVIASIGGADCVLIVTEPTLSGVHDMKRVVELANHFNIKTAACVNKFDLNPQITEQIETYCVANGVDFMGKIHFDHVVTKAMVQKKSVVEYSDGVVAREIKDVWENVKNVLR
ncbi:ATP-binding protein [bacterium]|nr:ATP-binding protein [bacterium]